MGKCSLQTMTRLHQAVVDETWQAWRHHSISIICCRNGYSQKKVQATQPSLALNSLPLCQRTYVQWQWGCSHNLACNVNYLACVQTLGNTNFNDPSNWANPNGDGEKAWVMLHALCPPFTNDWKRRFGTFCLLPITKNVRRFGALMNQGIRTWGRKKPVQTNCRAAYLLTLLTCSMFGTFCHFTNGPKT